MRCQRPIQNYETANFVHQFIQSCKCSMRESKKKICSALQNIKHIQPKRNSYFRYRNWLLAYREQAQKSVYCIRHSDLKLRIFHSEIVRLNILGRSMIFLHKNENGWNRKLKLTYVKIPYKYSWKHLQFCRTTKNGILLPKLF